MATQFYMRPIQVEDLPKIADWFDNLDDLALFDRCQRIPLSSHASEESWMEVLDNAPSAGRYCLPFVILKAALQES